MSKPQIDAKKSKFQERRDAQNEDIKFCKRKQLLQKIDEIA